ncbi:e3 ubiquitin-protein ligase RFWD3, partial [Trichonephila clavata]
FRRWDSDHSFPGSEIDIIEIQNEAIPMDANSKVSTEAHANQSVDDDGQTCTICFEPWTNSSEHRLVSLRCGHLFGRSCITRWLKGQSARCPQCNARARKSEIRNIYAKAVKVIDSTERDKALQELQKEKELRRNAEMNAKVEKLKHMMSVQECERLKKELMEANKLLQEYSINSFMCLELSFHQYKFFPKNEEICF